MEPKTVHICEDHQIVVEGIEGILDESNRFVVQGSSKSASDCRKSFEKSGTDILILDLQLPDANGLDLLKELRNRHEHLLILVLTMHNDPFVVEQVKKHGGNGYLLKDFGKKEILEALDCIRQDTFYKGPGVKSYSEPGAFSGSIQLTEREKEIISLTAQGKSSQEISIDLFISEHTVNTHKRNIYKKMGFHDAKELMKFAYDVGLV